MLHIIRVIKVLNIDDISKKWAFFNKQKSQKISPLQMLSLLQTLNMNVSIKLFILFALKTQINCSIKTWIQEPIQSWSSINHEQNECVKSKAIFNKQIDGLLYMENQQKIDEIILPSDGAIVLTTNSKVQFSNTQKCDFENVANLQTLDSPKRLWFSTKSWSTAGEDTNAARPDVFKIPCECDIVEFPSKNVGAVDLDYVSEIVADKIVINERTDNFDQFLESEIGQKMFLNSEAVRFVQGFCNPPKYCGCHNHKRFNEYTDLICVEESKYCEVPHCLQPIHPMGHCCPMCGAILNFRIKDSCDFNITNMNEVGRKLKRFRNGKYVSKINYYAGMVPGKLQEDNVAQLVVAEVGEYTGISVEFMNFLTNDDRFKGN